MKKIVVITTGGTIAMKYDSATDGLQPALGGDDLTAAVPALSNIARLEVIEFANVPSGHMTPFMMLELAKLVAKEAERPEVAGFVITHGTDTLEETAYFLSITLATTKPVCITGAMRGASDTGCDGPANLLAAVRTACEEDAINRGVLVVFADEIHLAENVVKSHTTSCHAFTSPDYGAIGHVDVDRITFFGPSVKPAALQTTIVVEPVYLLEIFTGMDEGLFQFMVDNKVAGVVIAAFGCGNVPPAVQKGIALLRKQDIPVVLTSRVCTGRVAPIYSYEGGGQILAGLGVIWAGTLTAAKARLKLMVLLANGVKGSDLQMYFK